MLHRLIVGVDLHWRSTLRLFLLAMLQEVNKRSRRTRINVQDIGGNVVGDVKESLDEQGVLRTKCL